MRHQALRALLWCSLAVALTGMALWIANPTRTRTGITQHRGTGVTAALGPDNSVTQTFTAAENGFQAVEVQVTSVVPEHSSGGLRLLLESVDAGSTALQVTRTLGPQGDDRAVSVQFVPQRASAGRQYRLTLECPEDCGIAMRTSVGDSLAGAELSQAGQVVDADLYLTTYYAESFRTLAGSWTPLVARWMPGLLGALLALGLPGLAGALLIVHDSRVQPVVFLGIVLTAGLAFWPLALLWTSTVGLRLSPASAYGLVAASALLSAAILFRRQAQGRSRVLARWDAPQVVAVVVTALTILLRLIQARELLVPAWVDSVHHTVLTALIVQNGIVPTSGLQYVGVSTLHYHYGFHATAAALAWLSGLAPAQSVLLLGQVLSGLAGIPLYGLVTHLAAGSNTRASATARWAGTVAAAVPAFLTFMPAYYVSWGRYTQLTGLVMLPVIIGLTVRLVTSRPQARSVVALAVLVGGLAVTHYRVLLYYSLFWVALAPLALSGACGRGTRVRDTLSTARCALSTAILTLLAIAPWAIHLVRTALVPFGQVYGSWIVTPSTETSVPTTLLHFGHTNWVLAAAAAGLALAIVRRRWLLVSVGIWSGLCLVVSDPGLIGLPGGWFVHGTSAAISYWLPAGVFVGFLAGDLLRAIACVLPREFRRSALRKVPRAIGCALCCGAAYALWSQADVVNSRTVLLMASDMSAITWARDNLPEDSLVLINTEPWQAGLPMGSDAGWWLPYLSGRSITYPNVLYTQGTHEYRADIRALAEQVQGAADLKSSSLIARLEEAGVTHVFVGTRGGPLAPERLDSRNYVELFRDGPTRIYRFVARVP